MAELPIRIIWQKSRFYKRMLFFTNAMKLIDHTPFFKDGQISTTDRLKAMWKYGASWLKEVEAQQVAIEALEKGLARGYTLLRNVTLPGLDIEVPLILVGPTGIYVLYVTPLRGTYRARGEEWGPIEGGSFRPARVNLLRRVARLGRAVQVYLQRQGLTDLPPVEAVLLCSDPGLIVESVRPIVRVVQRDALERFAISVSQARVVLGVDRIQQIINRILNPLPPQAQRPQAKAPSAVPSSSPAQETDPYVPPFALPPEMQAGDVQESPSTAEAPTAALYDRFSESAPVEAEAQPPTGSETSNLAFGFRFEEEQAVNAPSVSPVRPSVPLPQPTTRSMTGTVARPVSASHVRRSRRRGLTGKQIAVLILLALIQCVILVVAAFLLRPYFFTP